MKICVIGLGYVGLPLAHLFAKKYNVIGFDIKENRVKEINEFYDSTNELSKNQLKDVIIKKKLQVSSNINDIVDSNFYIITVPTPIDEFNNPDLTPLIKSSQLIGKILKKNDIVVYESTVYPGATEEICIPILEKESNLKLNKDFYVGYSPERINPGDKVHTVEKILKITSGSNEFSMLKIDEVYRSVIKAGTFQAKSIKVAEAAKVIENSQRDINIAFMNELSMIFKKMNISIYDVLDAAKTKWNFLPFTPGLVGGHCIGVDPYYLAHKAKQIGCHPEIILGGRRINDSMSKNIADDIILKLAENQIDIPNSRILFLGVTFKENCPDIRNSKIFDLIKEIKKYNIEYDLFDPLASSIEVLNEYNEEIINEVKNINKKYHLIFIGVAHLQFTTFQIENLLTTNGLIYDMKNILPTKSDFTL